MDRGHELTEELLHGLEGRIADEFAQAVSNMERKCEDYFREDEAKRAAEWEKLQAGEITEADYRNWVYRHEMMGQRWLAMRDTLARDLEHAREIALRMTGQTMPDVYALNANYATYQIEHDAQIDMGLTLYNHDTAEYLLGDQRQLMPGPSDRKAQQIAENKALQWDYSKIQSAVLQGVLQGENPRTIAARLMGVGQMEYNSAVRYARTMTTSAQNAGRYEAFKRAESVGVDLVVEWQATLDGRTRDSHRQMHGQRRGVGEPFTITEDDGTTFEILYPADCSGESDAPQGEIWNCRCTLLSWVKGFEGDTVKDSPKMNGMTFEEWQEGKQIGETIETSEKSEFTSSDVYGSINHEAKASAAFVNRNDDLYQNAVKIEPIDGYEDIVCHGDKVSLVWADADGKESNVSVEEFAEILKEFDGYKGGDIRLIACDAGAKGSVVAQGLANALNVNVLAPTTEVYVDWHGNMRLSSNGKDNDGEWVLFSPKRK